MGELPAQAGRLPGNLHHEDGTGPATASEAPNQSPTAPSQPNADMTTSGSALQHGYQEAQHAFSSQLDVSQSIGFSRPGPYNMHGLANALPQGNYRGVAHFSPRQQQYGQPAVSPSAAAASQYAGQHAMASMGAPQPYYPGQQPPTAPYYASQFSPSPQMNTMSQRANVPYYPSGVVMTQPPPAASTFYYSQYGPYPGQASGLQALPAQYLASTMQQADSRGMPHSIKEFAHTHNQFMIPGQHSNNLPENRQTVVRGPPRKPRQSGHAIWIGNLPPQTDLMSLVHHVCGEAQGLESLFLISKSNCAFANFRDETSCVAAQQKLHDSKFQSVRLVSRLRKSTVEGTAGVAAPTGPAATGASQGQVTEMRKTEPTLHPSGNATAEATSAATDPSQRTVSLPDGELHKERFFVLKSLTIEDLELSVQTGIWATQSHNEHTLNQAFQSAASVYLVFSANKSGEYFGYARMTSPINQDPAAAIEFAPAAQAAADPDLPRAIPTEATEYAPKGRIIDDSARGTIFWEAERDETPSDGTGENHEAESGTGSVAGDAASTKSGNEGNGNEPKAWGKPFTLDWMSTTRLPFYRTRGLRNPWNSNREVKIARDGTELEPTVGRRLVGLFHRDLGQSAASSMDPGGVGVGGPIPAGYAPARMPYQPLYHQG